MTVCYNNCDRDCSSVKMAGYILALFSFRVFMDLDFVSVHKNAKREIGQYPAILTELAWSIIYIDYALYYDFNVNLLYVLPVW